MGSSSSSQKKASDESSGSTGTTRGSDPKPLVGSSTPPKGPPKGPTKSTRNGTSSSTAKATENRNGSGVSGARQVNGHSAKSQNGFSEAKEAKLARAKTADKSNNNNNNQTSDTSPTSPNSKGTSDNKTASQKRAVSSRAKRDTEHADTRKSIVKKLEMGMDVDSDDADSIMGLTRMKTRMKLRRERTRMREDFADDIANANRRKSLAAFRNASKRVQTMNKRSASSEDEIYMGNINIDCPPRARIVRIFTSSTFTDTMHERNMLMKEAYPKVKAFCQELGYDFQVVDMRWGIRDQATDDNMTTEMCLRELKTCQKISTGPHFVTLMSHKYGYSDFPRCIKAHEFETVMGQVTDPELTSLFKKWYQKDMNARPPAYVVSPISTHLPDFLSTDREKKDVAKKQWWVESEKIQAALEDIAAKVFDAATARKYIRSVSETEIQEGLLEAKEPAKQCLWLKRTIEDLDQQESSYILSRYTECTHNNSEEKVKKSHQMLKELKERRISKVLPPENILESSVRWNKEKGIDPEKDKAHSSYLEKLCRDFVRAICKMIKDAVDAKKLTENKLVDEIVQHVQFCQEKCLAFHGRKDLLKRVENYLRDMNNEPLVLYADSGAGKTSVMAILAREGWKWMGKKASIVTRFIGTTPASSNLHGLLSSMTSQIRISYGIDGKVSEDLRTLIDEFESSLHLATPDHPLVLILDSLDMLDPSHNARQLQWLPTRLRANIKIIVSTLPGAQYEAFPVLQTTIKSKQNLLEIPRLPDNDVSPIVDAWLALKDRTLTEQQKSVVMGAFKRCPLPLFLKLAVDKASAWASYTPKNQTVLESTIRASIDNLFERLEKIHGHIFVSRALGYLSTARAGLTETELEDVLSCDDDVLNDVYMYWTPPIRRLPPLLLVRLRTDLSQYLVDRGADNVRVMFWYHRQFLEAAQNRYCGDSDVRQNLHIALGDFFAGTWANGTEKPFASSKGDEGKADRHVSSQPNKYGAAYNLRKMNNLPYHRCHAHQLDKLKDECLANFEFLLDKLTATSLWPIMDDFAFAQSTFKGDELLTNISDVLKLSQTGLLYEPKQLATQLIGRLAQSKITENFLQQCYRYPAPSLLADKQILTQPGGQLLHCMAGHKGDILSLDLSGDSKTALTCSDDGTVRLWNTQSGKQIRMLDGLGKVSRATFCNHDNHIHIVMLNKHSVRTVKSGEKLFDLPTVTDDCPSCATGEGKTQLVIFKDQSAMVYSAVDGSLKTTVECGGSFLFKHPAFAVGSKSHAAVTTDDQVYVTVLDTVNHKFSPLFRGFEPFVDDDIEDEIQYEVDEMTLTADGKFLVYSNIYTNDVVFLDFRGQKKTQVIKGNPNDYIRSLRCSPDNKYLYHVKAAFVNVLDMKTKKTTEELEHTVDVVSVCTHDMKTVVTAAEDSNVRVWDRSKKVQGISQNPGISAYKIRSLTIHENPRYIVGFGFKNKDGDSQFLFVYDLVKNCTVRERLLDCSILQCEMLSAKELLVLHDIVNRLCIIDIDTMAVTKVFQGYLPSSNWSFRVINSRKEVACLSFGRRNVKIYDSGTGKCAAILPSGQKKKLEGLAVNEAGTILVTWCEDSGPVLIFDLVRRKQLHVLTPAGLFVTEGEIALSPDGSLLLLKVEGIPPGTKQKAADDEIYLDVWDVKKGSRVSSLVDLEYYLRYNGTEEKSGYSSAVDVFQILDNQKVLVACDDYIMRVFDMHTGAILHRLFGHSTGIEIVHKRDSPFVLTYGSWTEENSLRLWNKSDFTCVTSYTLDKSITLLNWGADGKFLLASIGKPAEVVTWKFNNFDQSFTVNPDTYKVLLQGQDLQGYIDLVPEDDNVTIDPNDPDKDIPSDVDDDDDPI